MVAWLRLPDVPKRIHSRNTDGKVYSSLSTKVNRAWKLLLLSSLSTASIFSPFTYSIHSMKMTSKQKSDAKFRHFLSRFKKSDWFCYSYLGKSRNHLEELPSNKMKLILNGYFCRLSHCVKSVRIGSYFGPHFPVFSSNAGKCGPE